MIELDGSHEEGGGQILRTALGLSILTKKPFKIINIRKNRPKPGLKAQHLHCIKACSEFCNAEIENAVMGSESITFTPNNIKNRQMEINIGTAGSVTLLFQSVLLPMIFTESEIKIVGGTDVKWSIPLDYLRSVIKEFLSDFCDIEIKCEKRGYYPKGGGIIKINTKPKYKIIDFDNFDKFHQFTFGNPAIDLSQSGKLMSIKGISHASSDLQNKEITERQAKTVEISLKNRCNVNIEKEYAKTESNGYGITIYGVYGFPGSEKKYRVGADKLGENNIKPEENGRVVSEKLLKYIDNEIPVDEHLQDNIIPLLGLFGGRVKTGEITAHTKANIYVCEKFLDIEYEIKKQENIQTDDKNKSNNRFDINNKLNDNKNVLNQSEANFISVLSSRRP
jgi:RNA 3'-phosphate cyclase